MAEAFAGSWKLDRSENFEEYLKKLGKNLFYITHNRNFKVQYIFVTNIGVNLLLRKAASTAKPVLTFKIDGDVWSMTSSSAIKTHTTTFTIGKEEELNTADGRKLKASGVFFASFL